MGEGGRLARLASPEASLLGLQEPRYEVSDFNTRILRHSSARGDVQLICISPVASPHRGALSREKSQSETRSAFERRQTSVLPSATQAEMSVQPPGGGAPDAPAGVRVADSTSFLLSGERSASGERGNGRRPAMRRNMSAFRSGAPHGELRPRRRGAEASLGPAGRDSLGLAGVNRGQVKRHCAQCEDARPAAERQAGPRPLGTQAKPLVTFTLLPNAELSCSAAFCLSEVLCGARPCKTKPKLPSTLSGAPAPSQGPPHSSGESAASAGRVGGVLGYPGASLHSSSTDKSGWFPLQDDSVCVC